MTRIKRIPKQFTGIGEVKGYSFDRIKQSKTVAMYKVSFEKSVHYEVFIRKINTLFNNESYPSKHKFGRSAFTLLTKEKAEEKYKELNKLE